MKTLLLICILATSHLANAQQDEQLSLYMYNKLAFNPAYAGSRKALSAIAIGRFQWVNFDGAPNTQWFSIQAPLFQQAMGVGAHVVNDRIGNRTRTSIFGDVSGSIAVNKKTSRLSVGISAGFDMIGYDFNTVQVNDPNDPYFGKVFNETLPNVGAGIYYYSDKHFFGISSPRILEATSNIVSLGEAKINSRHFFITGGTILKLNSVLKLQPSALIKYTPNSPITADINVSLLMYEKLWTGIMYRFNEAMGVNIVYNIKDMLSIGYVYDFPINGLRTYQSGSHEIFLRFDFRPKKAIYSSPRYF
ncbi:MAG: type IX secretion system membrane protein PorP/SprF [Fluviicola sp.]|nr:type IX secretion system membrane protein PorP/SprF [Fluviicola sp.]